MKILAVGGGSGGHVTPVAAVFNEIKKKSPDAELHFWCDKKFAKSARLIIKNVEGDVPVSVITAGKLRRYHHLSLWQHIVEPTVLFPNLRDGLLVTAGFVQSFFKLLKLRPDVIFTKGGYVCLPVGWAARLLNIPIVVHDSDAHPGLTNRLLAKHAKAIATGAPLKYYHYPKEKSHYIGIPISDKFSPLSPDQKNEIKATLEFNTRPLVVVTGGGLGAKRLNDAIIAVKDKITPVANVYLISGDASYEEVREKLPKDTASFRVIPFVSNNMAQILGAADVVVARAGATTILELAACATPTILVPNAHLTGGHQLKNAKVYEDAHAAIVIQEDDIESDANVLSDAIVTLIEDRSKQKSLGAAFKRMSKPNAARDMAKIILDTAKSDD